jgi:hypothetical protein
MTENIGMRQYQTFLLFHAAGGKPRGASFPFRFDAQVA